MELSSPLLQQAVTPAPAEISTAFPKPKLEDVFRAHAAFIWRTLRRYGLSEADARDASQEVFLVVNRSLPGFEGRCAMQTWLYAICRSVARDSKRRAFRRYEVGEDAAGLNALDARGAGVQTPFALTEEKQKFTILLRILADLDDAQREVFALFELESLAGEDIAEILGLPLGTVHSRLRLARQAFQKACARFQAAEKFAEQRTGVSR